MLLLKRRIRLTTLLFSVLWWSRFVCCSLVTTLCICCPHLMLLRLSLEVMTILCRCENIETSEGVPLFVTGVAQVINFQLPNSALSFRFLFRYKQLHRQEDPPLTIITIIFLHIPALIFKLSFLCILSPLSLCVQQSRLDVM